jgi:hypothetical protein
LELMLGRTASNCGSWPAGTKIAQKLGQKAPCQAADQTTPSGAVHDEGGLTMPNSIFFIDNLPAEVRRLPTSLQVVWLTSYQGAINSVNATQGGAIAEAWAVVRARQAAESAESGGNAMHETIARALGLPAGATRRELLNVFETLLDDGSPDDVDPALRLAEQARALAAAAGVELREAVCEVGRQHPEWVDAYHARLSTPLPPARAATRKWDVALAERTGDPREELRQLAEARARERNIGLREALAQISLEQPALADALATQYRNG